MPNLFLTHTGRTPLSSEERDQFERYVTEIFYRLGMDLETEACKKTPQRWLQALIDMTEGYDGDPKTRTIFPRECVNCDENRASVQIVEGPINFTSLCEHHALPFIGRAYIGYLRNKVIIGLSKFTRIVRVYSRQFSVQERLAQEIANALVEITKPHGVIVYLEARHSCTQCRGVREMEAFTQTIEKRGAYAKDHLLVSEFLSLAGHAVRPSRS